ncbi:hypothetical protein PAHAL_7G180400 [Panicum hallii]|uniref:Uncharacterized protein n=1 Tax=Panicum hallii TaxID=206008 RepID=A0A2S3I7E4_9POAL|nr:uncharacterized protein LOC112900108 [Panicum hallii]PAN38557.1 hypothetical protein PAHAL_7G180400 [Panicum hallii]
MTTIEAVKRAYAEVMLNAAREAAARILAAERRAAALAGGMDAVRDDAVAALLRFKAISDAKIKEAKLQSLAHIKRIEELEMKLHSAQSTILSLEGELERAKNELNQTKIQAEENRIRHSDAEKTDDSEMSSHHSKICMRERSKSPVSSEIYCIPRNLKEDENVGKIQDLHNCNHYLALSGATHKESICFCSRGAKNTSSLEQHVQSLETPLGRSGRNAGQVKNLSISGKKVIAKKFCCLEAEVLQTGNLRYCKRRRSKRSGSRYRHAANKVQRKTENEAPNTSDGNGCMLLIQALEHDLSPSKIFDRQGGNHVGQHVTEAMMYLTDPMQSSFDSDNRSMQTVEPMKNSTEDEVNMTEDLSECRTQENTISDKKEDKNQHICNLDLDKFGVAPIVSSSTNEGNATISSITSNRTACLYTFNRRKRKSKHIEKSTDDSVTDKILHRMGPVEEHKSKTQVILTDSPQSNRRLLEVASQLISLSEK